MKLSTTIEVALCSCPEGSWCDGCEQRTVTVSADYDSGKFGPLSVSGGLTLTEREETRAHLALLETIPCECVRDEESGEERVCQRCEHRRDIGDEMGRQQEAEERAAEAQGLDHGAPSLESAEDFR